MEEASVNVSAAAELRCQTQIVPQLATSQLC